MSLLENSAPDTALGSLNLTPTPREEAVFIHLNLMYTWTLKLIYSAAIWKQVSTLFKSPHCTVLNIFIIFTENISFCSLLFLISVEELLEHAVHSYPLIMKGHGIYPKMKNH